MPKEIKEKLIEILREFDLANTDLEPERTTKIQKAEASMEIENEIADQILSLFEAEKRKAVEDYANDVIPKLTKKWRKYLEEEKTKWVEDLKSGKICHNCGAEKENDLSDWCPKCMEEE